MNYFEEIYSGKEISRNDLLEVIFKDQSQKYELYSNIVDKINEINKTDHIYYEDIIFNNSSLRGHCSRKYLKNFTKNEILLMEKIRNIFIKEYRGRARTYYSYDLNGVSRIVCSLCLIDYDDISAIEYCKNNIKRFYEYCIKLSKHNFFKKLFNTNIYYTIECYKKISLEDTIHYQYEILDLPEHIKNMEVTIKYHKKEICTLEEYLKYDLKIDRNSVNFCNVFRNQDILQLENQI